MRRTKLRVRILSLMLAIMMVVSGAQNLAMTAYASESSDNYSIKISSTIGLAEAADITMPNVTTSVFIDEAPLLYQNETTVPIFDGTTHQVTLKNADCATLTGIKINGTEIGIEETSDDPIYLEEVMEDQIDGITSEGIVLEYYEASEVTLTFNSFSVTKDVEIEYVYVSNIEAESISLDKTNAEMTIGDSLQLNATILPEDTTDKTLTWKSSDEVVATVVDGKVAAHKAGSAIITVATKGDGKTAACNVMVKEANHESDDSNAVPADIPVEINASALEQVIMPLAEKRDIVVNTGKTANNWVQKITFKNVAGQDPQSEGDAFVVTLDPTTDKNEKIEIEIEYRTGAAMGKKHYFAINNGDVFLRSEKTAYENYFDKKVPPFIYNTATCDDGVNYFVPKWDENNCATLQFGYVSKATATKVSNPITVILKIGTGEAINLQPTIVGDVYEKVTLDKNIDYTINVTEKFEDSEGAPLTYFYSVDSEKEEDFQPLPDGILTRNYTNDVGTSGDYILRFKAFDGEKYSAVYTVDINVINNKPVLNAGIKEKTITAFINDQIEIDWNDAFSDKNHDPLTYRVEVDGNLKYRAFEDTKYTCVYGTSGTYTFEVWANDGANSSEKSYKVTIKVNEPEAEEPNFDVTYDVKVNVPKDLTPTFYVTKAAGYNAVDVYDAALSAESGETVNGFTVWTVKVPENISRISYRAVDAEGKGWGGMSIATKAEDGIVTAPVTLRSLKGVIKTRIDGLPLTEEQAEFKVKTYEGSWVASGDSDTEDGYLYYRYLLAAYDNDATYTYYAVPKGELAQTYSEAIADFNPITPDSAETDVYPLPFNLASGFTIIAPKEADVKVFNQERYYKTVEQPCLIKETKSETTEWHFAKIGTGANMSYRVSIEGKITKIGYVSGDSVTITWDENDVAPTERVDYDMTTTYGKRAEDSIYLNVNGQNNLVLDVNESFILRPFRIWQLVNSEVDNIMIEPDFTYRVISGGNVISVAPVSDYNMNATNNRLQVKAKANGVAILEIGYDAVAFAAGEESVYEGNGWEKTFQGKMTYGAVDPVRAGLVVVQAGNAATDVDFGIQFSDSSNRSWDAEHDTVYFLGEKGQISFNPTVNSGLISEVAVSNDKGENWIVLNDESGMYTADIVPGNNIIRVKKADNTEAYQVVRGDILTVTLFDADKDGVVEAGEEISIRISGMKFPAGKMSGIYNPGGVTTSYTLNGKSVSNQTSQYQCSQTELVITVPENAEDGEEIKLSNGMTGSGWMGDPIGSHREITDGGKNMNGTALSRNYSFNMIPDITFVVGGKAADVEQEQGNSAPVRKNDIPETDEGVTIKVGEVYKLSLGAIFEDADGDKLNYKASVNDADSESVSQTYSFVPTKEGIYKIVFVANDGKIDSSDTYTVTITVEGVADKPEIKFDLREDEIAGWVTISFEDYGIRLEEELEDMDVRYRVPLGNIIEATRVPFAKYDTIASVTLRLLNAMGMYAGYNGSEHSGFYLTAIGKFVANETYYESFGEKQAGDSSGWMITLNKGGTDKDWFINRGANAFVVGDGDIIKWKYSCQLGADIDEERFPEAVKSVIELINKIGTPITLNSETAINTARASYEALTSSQKAAVSNYATLEAAESALAELKATEADRKAAEEVNKLIAEIGTPITEGSKEKIDAAREAYEKLSEVQKLLCNIDTLETAENLYRQLSTEKNADTIYKNTGRYMKELGTPSVADVGGEWMVVGLTRSGYDCPEGYYGNVLKYVEDHINDKEQLHSTKSTVNSRVILALTACGYDVTNVGGHNLLMGLSDMEYLKKQGINGPIWALIALDSHNYECPTNAAAKEKVTREKLIDYILGKQLADGGWALSGEKADSDVTGMALTALAPYYSTDKDVKRAIDKAVAKLSSMQLSDGSFGSIDGSCAESTAQIIVALTALGIDPEEDIRFIKKGISTVDALCTFAVAGGGFSHVLGDERDGMATEQGYYALTAYVRFLDGKTALYDMSDVTIEAGSESGSGENAQTKQDEAAAKTVEDLIDAIGTVTVNSESKIKAARAAYDKLTAAQKKLVDNYGKLTAAEAAFDVAKANYVESLIDAIGTVTVNSVSRIAKARVAYYNLTDAQKKLVDNYEYLLYAENALEEARVEYVEDLIDSIGTVTKNSKTKISRARTAYNNLSDSNKAKVSNLNILLEAEAAYTKLAATSATTKPTTKPSTQPATKDEETEDATEELTKFAEKVKEQIESINQDSLAGELLDAILAYEELTEEEKAAIDKEWSIENFKERIAGELQIDSKTGIGVSGAEWNIQIVVDDVLDITEIQDMREKLGGNTMLGLWDIYLEDVLTGKEVQPDGSILVKIPLALLGDYAAHDGLVVVHYAEDGTVEYLNSTVIEDCIAFYATEFSYYAVAGYMGASPLDNLTDVVISDDVNAAGTSVLPWVIGGGCGLALLAVLLFLLLKNKKVQAGN